MGLANKSVVLYQSIKIGSKWTFCPVDEDSSHFSDGPFYISWYDGKTKQMEPVGRDPEQALRAATLKRAGLAYIAAGGEISQQDKKKSLESAYLAARGEIKQPENEKCPECADVTVSEEVEQGDVLLAEKAPGKRVDDAVKEYLKDCEDRQGKTGYGLAVRTPESYEDRLCYLTEFKPEASMDDITPEFIKGFRRFLRNHENGLTDRTSYNIMQAVSTFLNKNGSGVAKPFLKEMSFPPTEVIPYTDADMEQFFGACHEEEELIFKFFLHSMAREMEVAHCEVRDLKFDKNILHICPKPDTQGVLSLMSLASHCLSESMMEIEQFLREYKPIKSECTRKYYRGFLTHFEVFLGERGLTPEAVHPVDIEAFAKRVKNRFNPRTDKPGLSDVAVQSHLAAVSSYYQWRRCREKKLQNPVEAFKYRRREPRKKAPLIAPEVVTAMGEQSDCEVGNLVVQLLRGSGLRLSELVSLNRRNLKIETGKGKKPRVSVKVKGKGGKPRIVPIGAKAATALIEYLRRRGEDGEPALILSSRKRRIGRRTVQRLVHVAAAKVGAGHCHPHELRIGSQPMP